MKREHNQPEISSPPPKLASLEMDFQPIIHKSDQAELEELSHEVSNTLLEKSDKNGVNCVWTGYYVHYPKLDYYGINFQWIFEWEELKKTGIDGLSGHITVKSTEDNFDPRTIDVDLTTDDSDWIETSIENIPACFDYEVMYEYELIPYRNRIQEEVSYDGLFLPSELNDTVLVIDEKRLHVNKVYLSYHSDFFRELFSSKSGEGQKNEIPIENVSYADFGLLMSTIYPKSVIPNDKTVEKLLELAARLLTPSVVSQVEFHLLHDTRIKSGKIIWMADKYGMPKLLKKCINELNTIEKAKKLYASPEYEKLSEDTKAEILDRLMKIF